MMKAKLTITHDRMTLKVSDGQNRLSMGRTRYSVTTKSPVPHVVMERMMEAFDQFMGKKDGKTYGEKMERLQEVAQNAPTFTAFATSIR
jgi:hypothetical protein